MFSSKLALSGLASLMLTAVMSFQSAQATLFQFEYNDTISVISGFTGATVGDTAKITVSLDNGGSSLDSQTWTSEHLQTISFDFNNGALVTTFINPYNGKSRQTNGDFTTDGNGILSGVMTNWMAIRIVAPNVTSTGSGTGFGWQFNDGADSQIGGPVYFADQQAKLIELTNQTDLLTASNWSAVSTSAVPVPAAVWLFGSALMGLVGLRKKKV